MPYKIIFTDIDGTLVGFGQKGPSPAVVEELRRVQQAGVKIAAASGRGPGYITPDFLGGIRPDYCIAFNGAYITDGTGTPLFACPMDEEQFAITEELGRQGHALGYSFDDGYYIYHHPEKLVTLSGATLESSSGIRFNQNRQRHLQSLPYVAFCNYPDELAEQFNRDNPTMKMVYHRPNTYDLCQAAHNKATAAARLLERLGLAWRDAFAIGDGGNDLELLSAAGMGVAMGNAPGFLRQAAAHVTDTVQQDGAAAALRRFFPAPC